MTIAPVFNFWNEKMVISGTTLNDLSDINR